uniref:NADH dehydrogenase subunit 7 n=1 Tax=Hemistasia phaeocysticola TaxID=1503927 RepID=A0A1V1G162_9EUGL|nr:NADH dehydrogenase subunit 7 [Hemistasia phaeocysticola]
MAIPESRSLYGSVLSRHGVSPRSTSILHFGPAHPAAHGVLRSILWLAGEWVTAYQITLGLLHRGTEALTELRHLNQCVGYMDRLDYVSMVAGEHGFCMAVESGLGVLCGVGVCVHRIMLLEINRMLNHLLNVACHAGDLGCLLWLLWFFEDRELLYSVLAWCSGARLHSTLMIPGGTRGWLTTSQRHDIMLAVHQVTLHIEVSLLNGVYSRIWMLRLTGIGVCGLSDIGLSGVMLRSTGIAWDLRVAVGYEAYTMLNTVVCCGSLGDSMDRVLLRCFEIVSSAQLVVQSCMLQSMSQPVECHSNSSSMEQVILMFRTGPASILHSMTSTSYSEVPKGELLISLVCVSGTTWRARFRCPDLLHLLALQALVVGVVYADVVALVGTIDVVFGAVDL